MKKKNLTLILSGIGLLIVGIVTIFIIWKLEGLNPWKVITSDDGIVVMICIGILLLVGLIMFIKEKVNKM